jgi:hypothetical protein
MLRCIYLIVGGFYVFEAVWERVDWIFLIVVVRCFIEAALENS